MPGREVGLGREVGVGADADCGHVAGDVADEPGGDGLPQADGG